MRSLVHRALARAIYPRAAAVLCVVAGALCLWSAAALAVEPAVSGLPDGRVYELVSPATQQDGEVYVPKSSISGNSEYGIKTERPLEAASDGEAVAYVGEPPSLGGSGAIGQSFGNEFLATRSSGGGWTSVDIQPPGHLWPRYWAFSSDLTVGILSSRHLGSEEPLSALAPGGYSDLYVDRSGGTSYQPLVSGKPPHREPSEFGLKEFGGEEGVIYAGGTSNLNHVLFEANDTLTEGAVDGGAKEANLYDSVGGTLHLVNVLPDSQTEPNAAFGAAGTFGSLSRVISTDGSRVFWTDLNTGDLYVRENDAAPQSPLGEKGECLVPSDACTVQVDVSHGGSGSGGGGVFWAASSDGSMVFFTDESQLTSDSTAAAGEPDLYEYDVKSGGLTDLSVDTNVGEHAGVQGVIGASEDGQYVYFVATGVLAEDAVTGQPNLYLSHSGAITFVATLSQEDNHPVFLDVAREDGDWKANLGVRTAEVTPDGHSLVFMSNQSLTGYDNEATIEGVVQKQFEVFVYDAELGRLTCVSCNPSGEPPTIEKLRQSSGGYEDYGDAFLPVGWQSTYQQRVISADGSRVFFDSFEPLVPNDTNGLVDVYEWERDGSGDCRLSTGCVYLLSGGLSRDNSYLVDASTSGDDVFLVSRAQLVAQDQGDDDELYDARVGGVQPLAAPACTGSGCQGVPASPPLFTTPASATFAGVGNFAAAPPAGMKGRTKTKKPKKARRGGKRRRRKSTKRSRRGTGGLTHGKGGRS
jgi:hypothetical protein